MSRIPALVDTVIHLKRASQAELAKKAGVHPSNLSKFLAGGTDIRVSSLEKILETLDLSIEELLEDEVERLIGKKQDSQSLGQAIEVLLREADPISAKTFIDSLSSRIKPKSSKDISSALEIVKEYKSKIKTARRS